MKLCWVNVSDAGEAKGAVIEEAVHQHVDAVASSDVTDLAPLPPTVKRVLLANGPSLPDDLSAVDIVLMASYPASRATLAKDHPSVTFGQMVEVTDAASLERACGAAAGEAWSLLTFRDPTKIPLEIVLAAASGASGSIITTVADVTEAEIVFKVLEHGSDGVMLTARQVGDVTALKAAADTADPEIALVTLEVTRTAHAGLGDRACVDTCVHFRQDEGILVGSHSKGMVLCCSETHPLPYMPTRPFRVNAGAIHSYTLSPQARTSYLSELGAGSKVLAVDCAGHARTVTVGRVKIESRPMLAIDAVSASGTAVNLIVQDDWHVRVLGPGGTVLNVTELRPGSQILGYLPTQDRHVGYPIAEFCLEK